ncbi:hypothetical protein [Achromobacter xylosoxidans]|uniref:hypothetical protein n=1 Tax=Alcaligenes xylosoxydans xylosoxydans TaxID=85698 RepID=UPI0006BFF3C5|nr:hypothetical protein [Achromobacter xylosoxidans]CUJ22084.1 Uncharacterised protein [Achromobacter xylosoxidans]
MTNPTTQPGAAPATGNTEKEQEMYAAGLEMGEANAKNNAAIRAATGWLPIESAPKDGTEFQAWLNIGLWEPRCRFNPDSEAFEIWGRVDYDRDDWDACGHLAATHWMPRPAAPGAAPGVSTVEDKPAAYLTLDEDGSPCMLFFDVVEARAYCEIGEEPEALWRRPVPPAGDAQDALPPLNADLIEILGRPNFRCGGIAARLRADGQDIKRKSEHEQAATIHFLLGHYLKHGTNWRETAGSALDAIAAQRKGDA